mgnify:CR=1 FL=1
MHPTKVYAPSVRADCQHPAAITVVSTLIKAALGTAALLLGWGIAGLGGVSIVTNLVTLAILGLLIVVGVAVLLINRGRNAQKEHAAEVSADELDAMRRDAAARSTQGEKETEKESSAWPQQRRFCAFYRSKRKAEHFCSDLDGRVSPPGVSRSLGQGC